MKRFSAVVMLCAGLGLAGSTSVWAADSQAGPLPQAGVASKYTTLSVPTALSPVSDSLEKLIKHGYHVTSNSPYPNGLMLMLEGSKQHTHRQIVCVLNPPQAGSDQNVPVSRCWALD